MASPLEKGLDFTFGVALLTAEALEQAINGLVEQGKLARENAPAVYSAILEKGRPARESLLRSLQEDVFPAVRGLGAAPTEEIRALEERVASLEKQVGSGEGDAAAGAPEGVVLAAGERTTELALVQEPPLLEIVGAGPLEEPRPEEEPVPAEVAFEEEATAGEARAEEGRPGDAAS